MLAWDECSYQSIHRKLCGLQSARQQKDARQQKETMCPYDIPMRPWAKVGTDLFSFNNRAYLFSVDYLSNFWEVDYFTDTSSSTVIHKLKAHFACHGIPDTVISDNGPQYSSQEFRQFSAAWEFRQHHLQHIHRATAKRSLQ